MKPFTSRMSNSRRYMSNPRRSSYLSKEQDQLLRLKDNPQWLKTDNYRIYKYPITSMKFKKLPKPQHLPQIEDTVFKIENDQKNFRWTIRHNQRWLPSGQKQKLGFEKNKLNAKNTSPKSGDFLNEFLIADETKEFCRKQS